MSRKKPDIELVNMVLDALENGASEADVARAAGKSKTTIARWAIEYARTPAAPPPDAAPLTPPQDDTDTLAVSRVMRAELIQNARLAKEVGNYSAAQRFMRDAAALQTTIARQEKTAQGDRDAVTVPRSEIEGAIDGAKQRVKALLARPLLCEHCGHELSVRWAEEDSQTEPTPAAVTPGTKKGSP